MQLINGYIEIPMGELTKHEFDMETNARKVDRVMPEGMGGYPVNYGYVPQTVSYDGDPFDVLVLGPALPGGELVQGLIVGLMLMEDEKGLDSKVVISPVDADGKAKYALTPEDQARIGEYFNTYKAKDDDPKTWSKVPGWGTAEDGWSYVLTTAAFFQQCRVHTDRPCSVVLDGRDMRKGATLTDPSGLVRVRGAREHNLKNVDVDIPRNALVVFTGVSGSGKSSLAFGTLYAEAQRRYLESVSPYARRLFHQMAVPDVDEIDGLPPAVALQQQRGSPSTRSSVGSVTTLSNLLRMLYSRAGDYPPGQPLLYAESFSPNTPEGACPNCHGLGRVYDVTEQSMVPDDSLTIRERAIAAWPPAWQGQNLRDILVSLGYDVDTPVARPAEEGSRLDPVHRRAADRAGVRRLRPRPRRSARSKRKEEPSYMGTFTGARRHVLHTFATPQSALMKKRVSRYMLSSDCRVCERQAAAARVACRSRSPASTSPRCRGCR